MIHTIRTQPQSIMMVGIHAPIIQSMLDFDYARGADTPSIVALISAAKRTHKCFFGDSETVIPVFPSITAAAEAGYAADMVIHSSSGSAVYNSLHSFFTHFPNALGAHIFAENVSEQDALRLVEEYGESKLIAGPSGVGLLVPGTLKLGAIGGVLGAPIEQVANISGNVAIVCSSGGMVNELIDTVVRSGGAPSFAVSYGGDRFPITSPLTWCMHAENDPNTDAIIFFGELGGHDEYDIAQAVFQGAITKPIYAYIAGTYSNDDSSIQFGHAKALAKTPDETAQAKRMALRDAGVPAADTFAEFLNTISKIKYTRHQVDSARDWTPPESQRPHTLFTAAMDRGSSNDPFVRHALCTLLEKSDVSDVLVAFTEKTFSLLIDHGAGVSGAVNTMITARSGSSMSGAVASGLLTVGDRFGGAINAAADNWFNAVHNTISIEEMLEAHKKIEQPVMGIGHKKYSIHNNDPRVSELISFAQENITSRPHLDYALATAERTTQKRPNLILNIDGALAAVLLDIFMEHEKMTPRQIKELIDIEFFNSFFLVPRTVGFVGNFLSQKRRDEGLFRLGDDQIHYE